MFRKLLIAVIALSLLVGSAFAADSTKADVKAGEKTKKSADMKEKEETKMPDWITTESGLKYRDIVEGKGEGAKRTDRVESHYTLWLADGDKKGKRLQSSKDGDEVFAFAVGQPGLIKGWNEGAVGMKAGSVRQLIIPPDLGWGAGGQAPLIPPNATVFFELELLKNITQDALQNFEPKKNPIKKKLDSSDSRE